MRPESTSPPAVGRPWVIFAIASAGWVFDVYEGQLFTIFKTPALRELLAARGLTDESELARGIDWQANLALAIFLVGGAVGGIGFGMLADRLGRVRVLSWTILVYSVFSAMTFFVREVWQLQFLRFLVALGVGGEWAVAASLVAEAFPTKSRAIASGTFHALSVLGVGLATLTGSVFTGPGAWRWGFLVGLAPALLLLWIRWSLREPGSPPGFASGRRGGDLRELLGDPAWRGRALLGLSLAAVGLGTYWGIYAWTPELVIDVLRGTVEGPEAQRRASVVYLLLSFVGGLPGLLAFAPLANRIGRRRAFAAYHLAAMLLAPVPFLFATTMSQAVLLLPLMAFSVVGLHAGYAIYFPELFPTRLRATGSSFCFNVGRLVGAIILVVRGALGATLGLRIAAVAISGLFVVGLAVLWFLPETKDQPLPE